MLASLSPIRLKPAPPFALEDERAARAPDLAPPGPNVGATRRRWASITGVALLAATIAFGAIVQMHSTANPAISRRAPYSRPAVVTAAPAHQVQARPKRRADDSPVRDAGRPHRASHVHQRVIPRRAATPAITPQRVKPAPPPRPALPPPAAPGSGSGAPPTPGSGPGEFF